MAGGHEFLHFPVEMSRQFQRSVFRDKAPFSVTDGRGSTVGEPGGRCEAANLPSGSTEKRIGQWCSRRCTRER